MLEKDIKKYSFQKKKSRVKRLNLEKFLLMNIKTKSIASRHFTWLSSFLAELVKRMDIQLEMDFMTVSSYHGGTESSGEVKLLLDVATPVTGREIIIVEDIIDTGRTLKYLKELLEHRGATVKIVTLLDKPEGRVVEIDADYTGFTIPNEFVVGFGLDFDNHYRNLPYVGVLKEEVYNK